MANQTQRQTKTRGSKSATPAPQDAPAPSGAAAPKPSGKLGAIVALLERPKGAKLDEMVSATGWQAHSVRGALAGSLKKKHGLAIISEKTPEGRTYRIAGPAA